MCVDKYKLILFTISIFALVSVVFGNDTFRMHSDRIWYQAEREPLEDLLERFSKMGAHVEYDPSIDIIITTDFRGGTLEELLGEVLGSLGFVVTWDVVRGPIQEYLLLNSLKIYRQGGYSRTKPYDLRRKREVKSQSGREFIANEVLIGFRPGTTRRDVEILLAQVGGTITGSVEDIGIYRIRFMDGTDVLRMVERLRNSRIVAGAEPNYAGRIPVAPPEINTSEEMLFLNDLAVPSGGTAYLAVLDSGLVGEGLPPELVAGRFDAIDPGAELSDNTGHGTRMAMVASGLVSPAGIGADENAEGVPLLAVRAFDDDGVTSNFDLMRGVRYAVDAGARVINLSWGTEHHSDFIARTMSYASSEGAIIVASAGNEPTGKAMYPAAYAGVLGIAATVEDGSYWEQSNHGDFIFAAAPGKAVLPTLEGSDHGVFGGTSISSALVAGTIARYMSLNPDATPENIVERLEQSLSPSAGGDLYRGQGVMDEVAIKRFLGYYPVKSD